ncbi:hypothetical protein DKX38_019815 [Salix brachista]|uniref:Uncharacterized protein n=1 Tax=Salix brachista TaxID=2182728 RepID=A0A5N5KHE2_9ROSI|nr:hypothetical protein DKX38_019815 [Salix brachista]
MSLQPSFVNSTCVASTVALFTYDEEERRTRAQYLLELHSVSFISSKVTYIICACPHINVSFACDNLLSIAKKQPHWNVHLTLFSGLPTPAFGLGLSTTIKSSRKLCLQHRKPVDGMIIGRASRRYSDRLSTVINNFLPNGSQQEVQLIDGVIVVLVFMQVFDTIKMQESTRQARLVAEFKVMQAEAETMERQSIRSYDFPGTAQLVLPLSNPSL